MKFNKILPLALLCSICLTNLVACTSDEEDSSTSNDSTVNESSDENTGDNNEMVLAWWGNQVRNERTQQVIDKYMDENPDVEMEGQFSEWSDYWNKLATSAAGNMLPDIVQMDYSYLYQYVTNDLLLDLTPYVEDGTLDLSNADPNIIESGTIDGGIYAICNGINAPALMYNTKLLEDNGISIKDNMSIDEFIDISREIYEKTGYKTDIAYASGTAFLDYMMRSMDTALYKENQLGASQDQLEEFFALYELGINEGWMCPPEIYTERTIGSTEQMPLVYGSSPSNMSWCALVYSNQFTSLQGAAPEGMEINMTTWPADDPQKANYLKPSQFFSVTVDSSNPEEATKFIDDLTNDVPTNEILLGERGVPISNIVSETIISEMDDDSQKIFTYINDVVSETSSPIDPPAPNGSAEVSDLVDQLIERVAYKDIDAAGAAEELFEKGNEVLASKNE